MREKIGMAILFLAGAGVVGFLVWFAMFKIDPALDEQDLLNQPGKPGGSVAFGDFIAVLDHVQLEKRDHTNEHDPYATYVAERATRVTIFDAANGTKVHQQLTDNFDGCAMATAERVWCALDDHDLALYEARTFKRIRRFSDLVLEAKLGKLAPRRWRIDGAVAMQLLDDGRVAIVDGAAATPVARREDKAPALQPVMVVKVADCFSVDSPKGRSIERGHGPRSRVVQKGVPSKDTYLEPVWIQAEAPLLLHHTSITKQDDVVQLSRMRPDGTAAWTRALARGCETVAVRGKLVVVTTLDPARRVIGVDTEDGGVRYSAGF